MAQKYIVQVAALASQEKANELQTRLKEVSIPAFTQKGSGELVRVRVGPFSKDEGEKVRVRLSKLRPVRQPGSELINKAGAA
ncbi:SPOR domain-containing protein [Massilia sp. B-10]|nr:SPOR domain-containing protein [Massilia sp. B-10]